MNKLIKIVDEQREQAQEDICCRLDGMPDKAINDICDIIVKRFNIVKNAIED